MILELGQLQQNDWQHAFSPEVLERGRIYAKQGLTRIIQVSEQHIEACCHGSAERPYRQHLSLSPGEQRWELQGHCNCPTHTPCKHMVAVLLTVEQLQAKGDPLGQPVAPPRPVRLRTLSAVQPTPVLQLGSHSRVQFDSRKGRMMEQAQHRAALSFDYAGHRLFGRASEALLALPGQHENLQIMRQTELEQSYRQQLHELGLRVALRRSEALPEDAGEAMQLKDEQAWLHLVRLQLPKLRAQGWKIEIQTGFRYDLQEVEQWYADVHDSDDQNWFDLEIGIEVQGVRISLLPILLQSIRQTPWLLNPKALEQRHDDEVMLVNLPRHHAGERRIALPYGRLKPVLQTLGELYFEDQDPNETRLRLPRTDAARLGQLQQNIPLSWQNPDSQTFAQRLTQLNKHPVQLPEGLNATLRPYQLQGVSWMQSLRELGMGGILADDMGLGKTLQSLTHLLIEKQAGRLQHPALIVMPTSLIGNWQSEAKRFAPALNVLALQGPKRLQQLKKATDVDVLLTTYSLLSRDAKHLNALQFSVMLLDEAQNIKNPRSKAAEVARELKAKQRLCLTGTPLENHLGELWSLFNVLMPGWLGDEKHFTQHYRQPIEKQVDLERLDHLNQRIRPFMLRRTKEQVASDLPPKTLITHWVDLTDAQRDRYEALRLAMDSEIRTEIARQGLASSQLLVIEALLRLRQVCCDLRLLEEHDNAGSQHSGKLNSLMQMLETLFAQGRRVLLFSQFTSMLKLIEDELKKRRIPYALLTGATRDRQAKVRDFQSGELPIFLISLKAGGAGLNLTAADTVIHFDPWWNPAAEAQASDRAYRIGQDKPVFVYKLIARGSVEEKIQQLQQRKAELAKGVLDGGSLGGWSFSEEDINELFAPLY